MHPPKLSRFGIRCRQADRLSPRENAARTLQENPWRARKSSGSIFDGLASSAEVRARCAIPSGIDERLSFVLPSKDQTQPFHLIFGRYQEKVAFKMAMEHKGVEFEVVQAPNSSCWKWTAFLDAIRMRTGVALTRADAVLDAELAIERALEPRKHPKK